LMDVTNATSTGVPGECPERLAGGDQMSDKQFPTAEIHTDGVTIRRVGADDFDAVDRLAERDSCQPPKGRLLGAEIEGRLLAVISLDGGESVADPSSRTAELRALLELRAAQLRRRERRRRFHPLDLPHPRTQRALAASQPGAPSWLVAQRPGPF
jgi:hypothetical protein